MLFQFNKGDIYYASFPYEENFNISKLRTVMVWHVHQNKNEVLVSKITSVIRGLKWEVPLKPDVISGIKKQSVVRVDKTLYLPVSAFIVPAIGSLNSFEIAAVEFCFKEYNKNHS